MKIEINQNENGVDVVTIDGEAVSDAVATIVLEMVDTIETVQQHEANCSFDPCIGCDGLGCEAMCAADDGVPGSDMAWGPEDRGCCPCGSPSCDGTCGSNTPF